MIATEPFAPVRRATLKQDLVSRILGAIFQGRFREGERLVVQRLADQFGVSITPVREALFEVAGIGLLSITPNCGAVMRPFGRRELLEIYQVRRVLEVEAARCACGRINPADLAELHEAFEDLQTNLTGDNWTERSLAADIRLHDLIANHCGSRRLIDEIGRYKVFTHVGRQNVNSPRHAQQMAIPAHLAILTALQAHDADAAGRAMSEHIERTAEVVAASMFPEVAKTAHAG